MLVETGPVGLRCNGIDLNPRHNRIAVVRMRTPVFSFSMPAPLLAYNGAGGFGNWWKYIKKKANVKR